MAYICIVVPRYGEDVLGGAETLARRFAEELVTRTEHKVVVLTTCARDHLTWINEIPPGRVFINGVPVIRFPVDNRRRDMETYNAIHFKMLTHQPLSLKEQYDWVDESAHSPQLYAYIAEHGPDYDFLIFIPYLFGTTLYGSAIYPKKSIIWPCLHDEVYAYLEPIRLMMQRCRGLMFNTEPEMALASKRLGIRNPGMRVVGFGMEDVRGDGELFRRRYGLEEPFVLFSGRLEEAKNLPLLVSFFIEYKRRRRNRLKLVLMGKGPWKVPHHRDILTIGFKPEKEKLDVFAAASILCQPSINESFSIVLMESWLAEVPVIVHGDCAVTRYHLRKSQGGLYFRTYEEFEGALDFLLENPQIAKRIGKNGRLYVLTNYNWDAVLKRFESALHLWSNLGGN
jgi:glycosyltransferase involved in cell wall biosynthesis